MKGFNKLTFVLLPVLLFFSCREEIDCDCDNAVDLRPLTIDEENVVNSSNNFAFDLFSRVNRKNVDDNFFISPISISTALSMTANGAAGETLHGIKKTLSQENIPNAEINESYKSLVNYLTNLDPKVNMSLANSTWYKQEYKIKDEFKKILEEYYDATVNATDFNDPGAKDLINGWIEQNTNGKIKDMIDQIPSNIVMYLINAIYLKATWQYQFDKAKTDKMDFTLKSGAKLPTDMMFSEGVKANFFMNEDLQFIELPYGNGQFVFSIILPADHQSLDEIINSLNTNLLNSYLEYADTSTFKVYLPKFKINYKILLNDILSKMGMEQSFGPNADLSNLFTEDLDLYISKVLHQSFLEVDEEGTEAAAATVVEIVETSAGPDIKPSVLYINRPFAFFIREKHSKAIIFFGKLINPMEQ
jgi:serine protease inhibitor